MAKRSTVSSSILDSVRRGGRPAPMPEALEDYNGMCMKIRGNNQVPSSVAEHPKYKMLCLELESCKRSLKTHQAVHSTVDCMAASEEDDEATMITTPEEEKEEEKEEEEEEGDQEGDQEGDHEAQKEAHRKKRRKAASLRQSKALKRGMREFHTNK